MKTPDLPKSTPYDDVWFYAKKHRIAADVDEFVPGVDSGSSKAALAAADASLGAAAGEIRRCAGMRAAFALVEGLASVSRSAARLGQIAIERTTLTLKLASLPATSDFQLLWAGLSLGAAGAALFTELVLTKSLTFLLGFRADDPTGRAMGAAFAASLLVFELVFERLRITEDPRRFFARSGEQAADDSRASTRLVRARTILGAAIVLALLGIALLQIATIVKMAPTREVAGKLRADPMARLTPSEEREVKQSVLFFSLCVLISGAFMAAVGKKEVKLWARHRTLQKEAKALDAEESALLEEFNKQERPALAGRLRAAGLPFMWLVAVPLAEVPAELSKLLNAHGDFDATKAADADHEAAAFLAAKRNALDKASEKPVSRPRRSTTETVDDIILGSCVPCRDGDASAAVEPGEPRGAKVYSVDRGGLASLRSSNGSQGLA
jgi:hypothetical protein